MSDSSDKCSSVINLLVSQLDKGGFHEIHLEKMVAEHPGCEAELRDFYKSWKELEIIEVPEPSEAMHARFYKSLSEAQTQVEPKVTFTSVWHTFNLWLQNLAQPIRWAMVAGVFMAGLFVGKIAFAPEKEQPFLVSQDIKPAELLYAGLNDKVSASERLLGIQKINQMEKPDDKVLEALYQVLSNDPNTNVRISAVESLVNFAHLPNVRQMLIKSIPQQESPLVQLALAEAMLMLQEKDSADEWRKLLSSDHVEVDVKHHLEETLETILY